MKKPATKYRPDGWRVCLFYAGLLMLITFAFCYATFETNDDNGITAITSGAFTGSPYAGNGYTSYLYGALVAALYSLWSGIPWHALVMLGVIFLSLAAILKSILFLCVKNRISIVYGLLSFLALYMGVLLQYVVKLQYTATAAFAGTGGTCLALLLPRESDRRKRLASIVLSAVLLFFSFCLRSDCFWVCMPLLVGFAALECFERRSLRPLLPSLVILLGAVALVGIDLTLYRLNEPNWDQFRAFYDYRCQLLDYHNTDLMELTATQVLGWPEATVKMLRNWYMLDELMSLEPLRALMQAVSAAMPMPNVGQLIKSTASILRRYPMFALNFIAFCLWGLYAAVRFLKAKQCTGLLRILGTAAYLFVFITYFYGILARLPERAAFSVACPCYVFLLLTCLPALPAREPREKPALAARFAKPAAAFLVTLILLGGSATLVLQGGDRLPLRWLGSAQAARQSLSENVRLYATSNPSLVYVTDIPQRYGPLYTEPTAAVNLVDWGHAMQGSDMLRAKWKANGFENMATEALFDPRVRLIITDDHLDMLLTYLKTFHEDAAFETVDYGAGFSVYRLATDV